MEHRTLRAIARVADRAFRLPAGSRSPRMWPVNAQS